MPEETCVLTEEEKQELDKILINEHRPLESDNRTSVINFINGIIDEAWCKGKSNGR